MAERKVKSNGAAAIEAAGAGGVKPEHRVRGPGWLSWAAKDIRWEKGAVPLAAFLELYGDTLADGFPPDLALPRLAALVRGTLVELREAQDVIEQLEVYIPEAGADEIGERELNEHDDVSAGLRGARLANRGREALDNAMKALATYASYQGMGRLHDLWPEDVMLLVNCWRSLTQRGVLASPGGLVSAAIRRLAAWIDATEDVAALAAGLKTRQSGFLTRDPEDDFAAFALSELKAQRDQVAITTGPWDALPDRPVRRSAPNVTKPGDGAADDDPDDDAPDDDADDDESAGELVTAGAEGGVE